MYIAGCPGISRKALQPCGLRSPHRCKANASYFCSSSNIKLDLSPFCLWPDSKARAFLSSPKSPHGTLKAAKEPAGGVAHRRLHYGRRSSSVDDAKRRGPPQSRRGHPPRLSQRHQVRWKINNAPTHGQPRCEPQPYLTIILRISGMYDLYLLMRGNWFWFLHQLGNWLARILHSRHQLDFHLHLADHLPGLKDPDLLSCAAGNMTETPEPASGSAAPTAKRDRSGSPDVNPKRSKKDIQASRRRDSSSRTPLPTMRSPPDQPSSAGDSFHAFTASPSSNVDSTILSVGSSSRQSTYDGSVSQDSRTAITRGQAQEQLELRSDRESPVKAAAVIRAGLDQQAHVPKLQPEEWFASRERLEHQVGELRLTIMRLETSCELEKAEWRRMHAGLRGMIGQMKKIIDEFHQRLASQVDLSPQSGSG